MRPLSLFVVFLLALFSCDSEDPNITVSVFTEEIVFTSGENAIFTGRLLSTGQVTVEDHGFEISETESFSNPITISLGEKTFPGRFVGEVSMLNIKSNYFCRAYATRNGVQTLGNMLGFNTLSPVAFDFEPKEGNPNNIITVTGLNFTTDSKILWNDQEITPENIEAESIITFKVPAIGTIATADIKVITQGDTLFLSDRFEYIIGEWTDQGTSDDVLKNNNHFYTEDASFFYYGLGNTSEFQNPSNRIFQIDKTTLERTEMLFSGIGVEGAFYTDGFFGGGSQLLVRNSDENLITTNAFFSINDSGIEPLASAPKFLYEAVAFSDDEYVYLYGGEDENREDNTTIFRYNIANDFWQPIGESPLSPRNGYPYISIGEENCFILPNGMFTCHDPINDVWNNRQSFPEEVKENGMIEAIDGSIYAGLQDISRKVYEYIITEDRWKRKTSIPQFNPFSTLGSWVSGNEIFVMQVNFPEGQDRIYWSFDPEAF